MSVLAKQRNHSRCNVLLLRSHNAHDTDTTPRHDRSYTTEVEASLAP